MKKRKNYIFTNKKNSDRAIMSVILGIISLVSLGIVIFYSYQKGGEATAGYGLTGILAAIFSLTGLVLSIIALKEKKYYKFFPVLGIILNLVVLAEIGLILYVGANLQ